MPNEKNLIPFSERSKSEARSLGRKGGKASGKARKQKKLFKDCLETILSLEVANNYDWNEMAAMGLDPKDINNKNLLAVALFKAAAKGDISAFKEIRKVIGEDETPNDEQLKKLDEVLSKIGGVI